MPTYLNPVYPHSCPDPFALKFCGVYYAYATGHAPDGNAFPVIASTDLMHWQPFGGALQPPALSWPEYWAPEVSYHNGRFYMYYSLGNEARMHLRVAVAQHPAGPFVDSGRQLTTEEFAIDAHVFADADGQRYLFYATDFLSHSHIGTGTVVDRLLDPFTLAGKPHPVTRARYDWQVYDPQRANKGGVRWYTVEGPFVEKHKGRYYQMFSGGNWQNPTYGVSYATTDSLAQAAEWAQSADGEATLPILRTLPGHVIGPGHNSAVRGPDNRQRYCIYHRWSDDLAARVLAIDPLDWAGERMLVLGPSFTPQPEPNPPTIADQFDGTGLSDLWATEGGDWRVEAGALLQSSAQGEAAATCGYGAESFLAEVSVRSAGDATGAYGVRVGATHQFLLEPQAGRAVGGVWSEGSGWVASTIALPADFDFGAFRLLRVERNASQLAITLDDVIARWQVDAPSSGPLALVTRDAAAAFAGFALTQGWEDTFEHEEAPAAIGWLGVGAWGISNGLLACDARDGPALLFKGELLANYELVVNVRLDEGAGGAGSYGIYLAASDDEPGPLLRVEREDAGWGLVWEWAGEQQHYALPAGFDGTQFQQLRLHRRGAQLNVQCEAAPIAELTVPDLTGPRRVGLWASDAAVAFDMVRVSATP